MFGKIKQIFLILNYQTVIISVLSILSTWLCLKFNILADFPLTLIGTAIIFPIVFSIGGAYKRREDALKEYGNLKAHGRALFYATRDWIEDSDKKLQNSLRQLLKKLLSDCRELFRQPPENMSVQEQEVYKTFSDLSIFITKLREKSLSAGDASRTNQFLSKMLISFENIKHIYQYRTPRTLRIYSKVFIIVLPLVYGPYFAYISKSFSPYLTYVMPLLFSIVLVSLDNIQDHLENPFDQLGADDVLLNAEKFSANLMLKRK